MSVFTGVLVDVSGSMEYSIQSEVDEEGGTWIKSIFVLIDDLIRQDVSRKNRIFAVAFGGIKEGEVFDVLYTIKEVQKVRDFEADKRPATYGTIGKILRLLEKNGACTIRKWASEETIKEAVLEKEAQRILERLESDSYFTEKFVNKYLPSACRNWYEGDGSSLWGATMWIAQSVVAAVGSNFRQATPGDIREVVTKAKRDLADVCFKFQGVTDTSVTVFSVQDAASIIRGCTGGKELTSKRARELLELVKPYIYCGTPLYFALREASTVLSVSRRSHLKQTRLLFILSDGHPADNGDINGIQTELKDADVTVVGCYISQNQEVEPKRLYTAPDEHWEKGARFMFNLSSTIPTQLVTRAIFVKRGWQIDIANNETRLFCHVNHPEHLKEVCDLAKNTVYSEDALSELLVSVDLDVCINQENSNFEAPEQKGGTCYANASAAVLYLAMHRILGRDGGYPDFEKLREEMISRHGHDGANTLKVLQEICPNYRLKCREVDINKAMKAVAKKRPVVAKYYLTDDERKKFGSFYKNNPTGVLKKQDLDLSKRPLFAKTLGHAVVLTSFNSQCLRLMNSWGDEWADMGFFRVENAEVLDLKFIDVYWKLDSLSEGEKEYYKRHGPEVADKLLQKLRALQVATCTCPECHRSSTVTDFCGTLSRAVCPLCHREFSTQDGDGNILALNIYLTSLAN